MNSQNCLSEYRKESYKFNINNSDKSGNQYAQQKDELMCILYNSILLLYLFSFCKILNLIYIKIVME